jgi:hypothetical protein
MPACRREGQAVPGRFGLLFDDPPIRRSSTGGRYGLPRSNAPGSEFHCTLWPGPMRQPEQPLFVGDRLVDVDPEPVQVARERVGMSRGHHPDAVGLLESPLDGGPVIRERNLGCLHGIGLQPRQSRERAAEPSRPAPPRSSRSRFIPRSWSDGGGARGRSTRVRRQTGGASPGC